MLYVCLSTNRIHFDLRVLCIIYFIFFFLKQQDPIRVVLLIIKLNFMTVCSVEINRLMEVKLYIDAIDEVYRVIIELNFY